MAATPRQRPRGLWLGIAGFALLCVALTCGGYLIGKPIWEARRPPTNAPSATSAAPATADVVFASPTAPPEDAPTATTKPDTEPPLTTQFVVTVINNSPYEVCYVYISPADSDSWGEDWLAEDETIAAGDGKQFMMAAGSYDLLARACDRAILDSEWKFGTDVQVDISAPGLVPFRMTNDVGQELCYVYISPSSADSWGDDQMGSHEVLGVDETRVFFIEPATVDVMVQDCEQVTVAEAYGIVVQNETSWSISEGGIAP